METNTRFSKHHSCLNIIQNSNPICFIACFATSFVSKHHSAVASRNHLSTDMTNDFQRKPYTGTFIRWQVENVSYGISFFALLVATILHLQCSAVGKIYIWEIEALEKHVVFRLNYLRNLYMKRFSFFIFTNINAKRPSLAQVSPK